MHDLEIRRAGGDQGAAMLGSSRGRLWRGQRVARFGIAAPRLTVVVVVVVAVVNWPVLLFEPEQVRAVLAVTLGLTAAVTVHELGHFVAGTSRGLDLYVRVGPGFGWCAPMPDSETADLRPWGMVAFAVAGPLANLSLYALLGVPSVASQVASTVDSSLLRDVVEVARVVSLPLGLFNLLPIGVLDGGRIVRVAVDLFTGRARVLALRSFQVFTLAASAVLVRETWVSSLPGWMAVTNTVVFAFIGGGVLVDEPPSADAERGRLTSRAGPVRGRRGSLPAGVAVLLAAAGAGLVVGSTVANQLLGP